MLGQADLAVLVSIDLAKNTSRPWWYFASLKQTVAVLVPDAKGTLLWAELHRVGRAVGAECVSNQECQDAAAKKGSTHGKIDPDRLRMASLLQRLVEYQCCRIADT